MNHAHGRSTNRAPPLHVIETSSLVSCLLLSWSPLFFIPHSSNEKFRLTAMNIDIRSHIPANTGWIIFHLCNPFDLFPFQFQLLCRNVGWGAVMSYCLPLSAKKAQKPRLLRVFHLYGISIKRNPSPTSPSHHSPPASPLTIQPCSSPHSLPLS